MSLHSSCFWLLIPLPSLILSTTAELGFWSRASSARWDTTAWVWKAGSTVGGTNYLDFAGMGVGF